MEVMTRWDAFHDLRAAQDQADQFLTRLLVQARGQEFAQPRLRHAFPVHQQSDEEVQSVLGRPRFGLRFERASKIENRLEIEPFTNGVFTVVALLEHTARSLKLLRSASINRYQGISPPDENVREYTAPRRTVKGRSRAESEPGGGEASFCRG